jgi:putative SOS response-associated peptidase YedK
MCGRFSFHSPHETVVQLFGVAGGAGGAAAVPPRWNIAPSATVVAVRATAGGQRELALLHWGLVPSWAKERSIGERLINARVETLREKPAFRSAFRKRRCLVVADGYYEWRAVGAQKQPYLIAAANGAPFGMAALWETWADPAGGAPLESCVIVTRESAGVVRDIHARMPAIVAPDDYAAWLDPASADVAALETLLTGEPRVALVAHPVSRRVNNPRNEGPELAVPSAAGSG